MSASFYNAFSYALLAPPVAALPTTMHTLVSQPGFAVYRNTVINSLVDALQANFPAVARLTGKDWFRAAAGVYARATPPDDVVMLAYGASFPVFLEHFEPALELPYLPDVARLDRFWSEAHVARDEPMLDAAALAVLPPEKLAVTVLYPHAAARWAWFEAAPIYSIWSRNREAAPLDTVWEPAWQGEGALLTRAHGAVQWRALDAAGCAFLQRCADGGTVTQAISAALNVEPTADLRALINTLLAAGAFSRMSVARIPISRGARIFR